MSFQILKNKDGRIFYITLGDQHSTIYRDREIIQYIGISFETYVNELKLFNVTNLAGSIICFFSEADIKKAVEYLNEKYAVVLRLLQ